MPGFLLDHMTLMKSNAYANAPAAGPEGLRYPVVLYSHGWTGFRTIASNQIEAIAAAGFIVIAPDHTYGAAGTLAEDGSVILNNPKAMPAKDDPHRQEGIEKLVDSFAGDLQYLLDTLPKLDSGEVPSPLKGRFDLMNIGVFGHSTGGGAAVELAKDEPRIKAMVGLDIWCEPVSPQLRDKPRDIPFASIRSQDWHDHRDVDRQILHEIMGTFSGPKYDLYLAGSRHGDFTMVPLISPFVRYLVPSQRGTTPAQDATDAVDSFLAAFFLQYLKPTSGIALPPPPAVIHPALKLADK